MVEVSEVYIFSTAVSSTSGTTKRVPQIDHAGHVQGQREKSTNVAH